MREICRRLGLNYEPVVIKWESMLVALLADKYDIVGNAMGITEERQKSVTFCDGWIESGARLVVHEDSAIQSSADAKGKSVGVITASIFVPLAEGWGAEVKHYQSDVGVMPGPNFVGCKNEFVIRRILAVCESSGMSASWGKREERIFPFRGGVQGGSRRVGARRGRTGALARWCPDARPGWGGRRLSVWLVRGALARRRGGVWRSADGLGGGTRSAL